MAIVPIDLPHHRYEVMIEPDALKRLGTIIRALAPHDRCALLADLTVYELHGSSAHDSLAASGYQIIGSMIPSGEQFKNLDTVRQMYDVLLDHRMERRSPVIALGGGVTGDTVGFIAATYLRGVPFVQCPTTLLAMVDASVGGKVGVNVEQGKNLIGAFYQPVVVVIDPHVLGTLPLRERRCGLAECIKHGMIRDADLFDFIATELPRIEQLDTPTMVELLERNVAIKAAVVIKDEKESGVRAHLNFGHTFAHAIEATSGYGVIQHGEAVALGMVAATHLATDLGMCESAIVDRLVALLRDAGLPVDAELVETDQLMKVMRLDKKVKDNRVRFVLPTRIGDVALRDDVPDERVAAAWEAIRR